MSEKHALAAIAKATVGGTPPAVEVDTIEKTAELPTRAHKLGNRLDKAIRVCLNPTVSALQYSAIMRFLKLAAEAEFNANLKLANAEYAVLRPEKGVLVVPTGVVAATFKSYTQPKKYNYPDEIKLMELKLKEAKTAAEATGAAKLVPHAFDATSESSFSISVQEIQ